MQKASRTVLVKSSHLLEKTSSLIASTRSSAHQFSKRFYATSCISSPNKPCYPGAVNATFTHQLEFRSSINPDGTPFPIFNIMSNDGEIVNEEAFKEIDYTPEQVVDLYKTMIRLETMDDILYNAQRQGRVSFYMTNYGEEALQVGSASALSPEDMIFAQYREAGVLMYRGFTLNEFLNQCFSTIEDYGKGRQMPVHYGSKKLNFQTISSPLGTQIPQAAGAGYVYRIQNSPHVCACYFGEGAASEGDFHAALNFASTLSCQTLFICRNNGFAISTPTRDQYHGDGIVARGIGYGMPSIRVDGNDLFAVYYATKRARQLSIESKGPVLIEFMTYRAGHHSTSDDASRYRSNEELMYWRNEQNPIIRVRKYLEKRQLWNDELEKTERDSNRKTVLSLLAKVEHAEKPHLDELVKDVFDSVPPILQQQREWTENVVKKYPEAFEGH
ncbi:hypothetical protein FDP41_002081 [Naegleria fowleri]|uniref:2-oxoisovalerate dehydrogenase subunit alpha n=1 Tax=Naegleria fowleri TaxID=5763 RepID=A0A6A5BWZ3_NAEFO|nr:uncharacterized protein FDP41_002081 [Naegleria fowleri]KAF0979011.1 hypothetical protein FDP41_002081 [Naegleria fowleri]